MYFHLVHNGRRLLVMTPEKLPEIFNCSCPEKNAAPMLDFFCLAYYRFINFDWLIAAYFSQG